MNKIQSAINEIVKQLKNTSPWLGLSLSILWVFLASFLYFDNLIKHPNSFDECLKLNLSANYFESEEDFARKDDALEYAKRHGNEAKALCILNLGFKFLKPTFSIAGYLNLTLWPILMTWLVAWFVMRRRKYFIICALGYFFFLIFHGLLPIATIFVLTSVCMVVLWLLLKKAIYALSSEVHKAKNDSQGI